MPPLPRRAFALVLLPLLLVVPLANADDAAAVGADPVWEQTVYDTHQLAPRLYNTVCDITTHGAIGDNKTLNTQAIIDCLHACQSTSAPGVTTMLIPPGQFLTGAFNVSSGTIIHLAEGAQLLGSQNVSDYPYVRAIYSKSEKINNALISAYNANNIAIIGASRSDSIINGQGWNWWVDRPLKRGYQLGPRLVELINCTNIVLTNFSAINSARWHIHVVWSRNVTGTQLTITGPRDIGGTDGFDPSSCQNVRITDCHIDVGDDGISVKSVPFYWYPELPMMPSAVTHIARVYIAARNFAIGAHCKAGIRDILYEDSEIGSPVDVTSAWAIKIKCADGYPSVVENIVMRNIRLGRIGPWWRYPTEGVGFVTSLDYGPKAHDEYLGAGKQEANDVIDEVTPPTDVHPIVRNVTLQNVTAVSVRKPGIIFGRGHTFLQEFRLIDIDFPNTTSPWSCGSINYTNSIAVNITPSLDLHKCKD